jgi:hypothetical protein
MSPSDDESSECLSVCLCASVQRIRCRTAFGNSILPQALPLFSEDFSDFTLEMISELCFRCVDLLRIFVSLMDFV